MSLLEAEGLEAFYGGSQALFGASLRIEEGETLALMGRNGMGKTTTIRAVMGLNPPRRGRVSFGGRDLQGLSAPQRARLGLGLVPEGRRCFPNLTVRENLLVAARPEGWSLARVEALFPRLGERREQMAATLSGGEQQMLAIGRALTTGPRLLILDEATEGLAPLVRQDIWTAIRSLKAEGLAILAVDKTLSEILGAADRCVILERGATVFEGPPEAVTPEIQKRWLGL
ncbi:ABC transporter ATP-binding protein [Neomegalonema sp.]|uniref:ABC transporter ATP-binding protein n=1 Tax=Neomegalonema sp. TaxID=2039713 RepID=UPI00262C275E|nr:ABC transporter ATP-binding protein [Neomegalonema sp.]MDD2868589.1 ABC transporter ATP-binding protein [Neomegalonema sp.]